MRGIENGGQNSREQRRVTVPCLCGALWFLWHAEVDVSECHLVLTRYALGTQQSDLVTVHRPAGDDQWGRAAGLSKDTQAPGCQQVQAAQKGDSGEDVAGRVQNTWPSPSPQAPSQTPNVTVTLLYAHKTGHECKRERKPVGERASDRRWG